MLKNMGKNAKPAIIINLLLIVIGFLFVGSLTFVEILTLVWLLYIYKKYNMDKKKLSKIEETVTLIAIIVLFVDILLILLGVLFSFAIFSLPSV